MTTLESNCLISTSSFFDPPYVVPGEFVSGLRSMSRFLCGLCRRQVDEVTATSGQACSVFHKTRYSQLKSNSSWGSSLYTQNKKKKIIFMVIFLIIQHPFSSVFKLIVITGSPCVVQKQQKVSSKQQKVSSKLKINMIFSTQILKIILKLLEMFFF